LGGGTGAEAESSHQRRLGWSATDDVPFASIGSKLYDYETEEETEEAADYDRKRLKRAGIISDDCPSFLYRVDHS